MGRKCRWESSGREKAQNDAKRRVTTEYAEYTERRIGGERRFGVGRGLAVIVVHAKRRRRQENGSQGFLGFL